MNNTGHRYGIFGDGAAWWAFVWRFEHEATACGTTKEQAIDRARAKLRDVRRGDA